MILNIVKETKEKEKVEVDSRWSKKYFFLFLEKETQKLFLFLKKSINKEKQEQTKSFCTEKSTSGEWNIEKVKIKKREEMI